jgi:CheY-like chemotaxis protein
MNDAVDLLPPRILVLDDERQIHASIKLRLGGTYDLAFAFEGAEALEKIRGSRFDLCLVDIHMPKMDGFAFIAAAQEVDPGLGFIILSAFDSPANLRKTIPLQVYDFLSKPLPERAGFEGRLQMWVEQARLRRRERALAQVAGTIAEDRDTALVEREVELVVSETARDALREVAGLLTTVQAHLLSATTQLAARARTDATVLHLLRGMEEARKAGDAAMTAAEGFFDSSYGNRDNSAAVPNEGIRDAMDIAARMCRAEASGKVVEFLPADGTPPIRDLSGVNFLLMLIPALGAALTSTAPNSTVGIRTEIAARLDAATKDPVRRDFVWFNRKRALGSRPALVVTITASAAALTEPEVEAWLGGNFAPLNSITTRGLLRGVVKCQGALGVAARPPASQFALALVLPT